jgi:hypothetical protein
VYIIESMGEEWLTLKGNAGADDPRGPLGLRQLPEKKESQCIVCSTEEGRWRVRTVYTDAARGCMENASLTQVLTAKGMYELFCIT